MVYGFGSASFSAKAASNLPFSQSWMYALLARFWIFIVMPAFFSCDCTAIDCELLVASRSFEVIAVNVKPPGLPAFLRYDLAVEMFCLGQTAEIGFEAKGPSGTGPMTFPWPSTELVRTAWRSSAHAIASRL